MSISNCITKIHRNTNIMERSIKNTMTSYKKVKNTKLLDITSHRRIYMNICRHPVLNKGFSVWNTLTLSLSAMVCSMIDDAHGRGILSRKNCSVAYPGFRYQATHLFVVKANNFKKTARI